MWFSALKLGLNAATHIYKKKQETKMKMADAMKSTKHWNHINVKTRDRDWETI